MPTLLLIDDNTDFRSIFQRKFESLGYAAHVAADGVRGLQMVMSTPPDLILLDLNMPHRGGLETLRLIRSVHPKIKVIVLTGYIEDETRAEAQTLGVADIILKPISMKDLADRISAALTPV